MLGALKPGSDRDVETYASNITLENCELLRSGKFMWDYGYLWQITVWPEAHSERERAMAQRYFPHENVHGPVQMSAGSDRVMFDNKAGLSIEKQNAKGGVVFFGDSLPENIVKGKHTFWSTAKLNTCASPKSQMEPPLLFLAVLDRMPS